VALLSEGLDFPFKWHVSGVYGQQQLHAAFHVHGTIAKNQQLLYELADPWQGQLVGQVAHV